MKRTTIFLPEDLHGMLRREALGLGISMAALIRSELQAAMQPGRSEADPLMEVAGICDDGGLTVGIDRVIYGI